MDLIFLVINAKLSVTVPSVSNEKIDCIFSQFFFSDDTSTTADTGSMANRISKGFAIAFGVLILFALVFLLYKRLGCSCSQKKFIVPKYDCDLDQEHLEMQNYGAGVDVQGQERIAAAL